MQEITMEDEEELSAPGFRFYPTEEELVSFYLHNKLEGNRPELHRVIPAVDIHKLEPWHLPKVSGEVCREETEQWFFFAPRQESETRGGRPNRTTASGYWKATGSPSYVYSKDNRVIGVKKTMVFYKGKAPTGRKTKWKMNEYKAIEEAAAASPSCTAPIPKLRHEFSLCRVYVTSGSVRAFDRRPSEIVTRETIMTQQDHGNAVAATHSQNTPILGKSSTPDESSCFGGDVRVVDHLEIEGSSNSAGIIGVEPEPLWSWEQMDWL